MSSESELKRGIFNCPNCGAAAEPESICCRYCQSSLAMLICSSCFGAVRVGMKHCPSCGAAVSAQSSRAAEDLQCPRCAKRLAQIDVGHHVLAECLSCGGLWVDRATFDEIAAQQEDQEAVLGLSPKSTPAPAGNTAARAYVPCPACSKLMNRNNYAGCSGIVIDWCREHGSWFDSTELQRIVRFIRNGGLRKSRERQKEALRQEAERLKQEQRQLAVLSRLDGSSEINLHADSRSLLDLLCEIRRCVN